MYAPVHILPLIAFRRHALMDDPVGQAKRLVQAIFASSSFLSTYVILLKGSMCFFEQVCNIWFELCVFVDGSEAIGS